MADGVRAYGRSENDKSFVQIRIKRVRKERFDGQLDQNFCHQVGVRHHRPLPQNAPIQERRRVQVSPLELKWASYVHLQDREGINRFNENKRGTVTVYCLFVRREITLEDVRWWLDTFVLHNIGHGTVSVTWGAPPESAGLQGEADLVATGETIRQNNPLHHSQING
jgi:hypothetical protein